MKAGFHAPVPLSLFTIPKAFTGHTGVIQRNAIRSWDHLGAEVILIGEEDGIAEMASAVGAHHEPAVARNEYGTPLVSDAFRAGQRVAKHAIVGYANADIIFTQDLADSVRTISAWRQAFLIVGRRWNLPLRDELRFEQGWEDSLRRLVKANGRRGDEWWLDYFVFPRGLIPEVPPFAVGRAAWDNWLLYDCRQRGIPVVDVSGEVVAVHQDHGHAHVPGATRLWLGPESDQNVALVGGRTRAYSLADATHALQGRKVRRHWSLQRLRRFLGSHSGLRERLGLRSISRSRRDA